jgi:hypothetical protein
MFPFEQAQAFIRQTCPSLVREGNVLRWPSGDGVSELEVRDLQIRSPDGLTVRQIVTLTHTSAPLQSADADLIASINTWSTISALVPGDGHFPAQFVSKVGIFEGDSEAAERVYAPLICTEAVVVGWHAARMARGQLRGNPDASPLTLVGELPVDAKAFEAAAKFNRSRGFESFCDAQTCTVEFPWDPGSYSRALLDRDVRDRYLATHSISPADLERMAGRTSLFEIRSTSHPLYGNGVLSTLTLPVEEAGFPALVRRVHELNRWELDRADLPPLFGAWCLRGARLCFVSFAPTAYCRSVPGLLMSLSAWASVRNGVLRDRLGSRSAPR